jgi:hypothetical protein
MRLRALIVVALCPGCFDGARAAGVGQRATALSTSDASVLLGAAGAIGPTGAAGQPGANGAAGETGVQGPPGVGYVGATGATGVDGATGAAGPSPWLLSGSNAYTNGSVMIGTTTPNGPLAVVGAVSSGSVAFASTVLHKITLEAADFTSLGGGAIDNPSGGSFYGSGGSVYAGAMWGSLRFPDNASLTDVTCHVHLASANTISVAVHYGQNGNSLGSAGSVIGPITGSGDTTVSAVLGGNQTVYEAQAYWLRVTGATGSTNQVYDCVASYTVTQAD